jgi:purine nucleoside permease
MRQAMKRIAIPTVCLLVLAALCTAATRAQSTAPASPIHVKVVVVTMFERGNDTGDAPGEFQFWVEREHLDQVFDLAAGFHHVRMNKDGVLGMVTGEGAARAAASIMALGLDPRFDLSKAYWIVAGIGGGDPADVSIGSGVWVEHVVDGDLAFEIDAREIPKNWPTGYIPFGRLAPYQKPTPTDDGNWYTLNPKLVAWAYQLTKNVPLDDLEISAAGRKYRASFVGFPNAQKGPFVTEGDEVSSSTFWHGALMSRWANHWDRYFTGGNYMVTAMEDSGTLQSLTFLNHAGRVDLRRVLVLRTISNYDRQPPGETAAESLRSMAGGKYPGYPAAFDAAERVGDTVVRNIVANWPERESSVP